MGVIDLTALLAGSRVLLLDFDGPVCDLFAGHPAPGIAAGLRRLLVERGVPDADGERDPMEVLRHTATLGRPGLTGTIEDALCAAELVAARSATPTPYARELIVAAHRSGRRTAIVSNNSAAACRAYLRDHGLERFVHPVVGRAYADPARMKPDPVPVLAAMHELDAEPGECVLIGDSVSDLTAARRAGVAAIGYANKPGKAERLVAAAFVVQVST